MQSHSVTSIIHINKWYLKQTNLIMLHNNTFKKRKLHVIAYWCPRLRSLILNISEI